ncbi:MEDS domain-containing protein [Pseudonocardia bannensis]|uniref:MEDS domain-containing protein n=1 Tax=Pseudonocardia bannensis TaxID=630973 RepID=A0A848DM86_9PSEU|nr:MEDS domain-containing protein [Pseudonocardia bannensis]NMH93877.1 hypothetical protein [Pseudonocardia bannensis]
MTLHPRDHVCAFVEGSQERDRLLGSYLFDGLRAGRPCLYLADPAGRPDVLALLDDVDPADRRDLLHVVDPASVFLKAGRFDGDAVLQFYGDWFRSAAGDDVDGPARIAVDMSWAHAWIEPSFVETLVRYEARFTTWMTSQPHVCLSVYDLREFGVTTLLPVIKSQYAVWLRGVVVENPYHVDPAADPGDAAATATTIGPTDRSNRNGRPDPTADHRDPVTDDVVPPT